MVPRINRSIVNRPADKLYNLLIHSGPEDTSEHYSSSYKSSFQSADHEIYLSSHIHPTIEGYYSQVKNIIEQKPDDIPFRRVDPNGPDSGQRDLGTVRYSMNDTKRLTHGIVTSSDTDMRKIIYPGCEVYLEPVRKPNCTEFEQLKLQTHGSKSNSDPSGARTWKALKYQSCKNPKGPELASSKQPSKKQLNDENYRSKLKEPNITNIIVNQDIDKKYISLQTAINCLSQIRSVLYKNNKSAINICRKIKSPGDCAKDAIQILNNNFTANIDYTKIQPVVEILNLEHLNQENIEKLWDLLDHQIPLSRFKFGSLIRPFRDDSTKSDFPKSKQESNIKSNQLMELRLKTAQFKDYDTAADLINPKPGTPFGLSHLDYFVPRRSEDIKTIFRNFNLDEQTFLAAWKKARKMETCNMNKVSVESFKSVLQQDGVNLNLNTVKVLDFLSK